MLTISSTKDNVVLFLKLSRQATFTNVFQSMAIVWEKSWIHLIKVACYFSSNSYTLSNPPHTY